jgi:hypothetical protein
MYELYTGPLLSFCKEDSSGGVPTSGNDGAFPSNVQFELQPAAATHASASSKIGTRAMRTRMAHAVVAVERV